MLVEIKIFIYRRLDNRKEGLPDDSPRALELHNRRKKALHDAFDGIEGLTIHWGNTDDTVPHEMVVLSVTSNHT
jgi:hypothetical protein